MVQQLEQQKQQLAEAASQHQTEIETLARLLQGVYTNYLHMPPVTILVIVAAAVEGVRKCCQSVQAAPRRGTAVADLLRGCCSP